MDKRPLENSLYVIQRISLRAELLLGAVVFGKNHQVLAFSGFTR